MNFTDPKKWAAELLAHGHAPKCAKPLIRLRCVAERSVGWLWWAKTDGFHAIIERTDEPPFSCPMTTGIGATPTEAVLAALAVL